ncbi:MAG: hypothetical protein ACLQFF_09230 [Steroidobacteraceae bacterium]|jgi:hypothetical protein
MRDEEQSSSQPKAEERGSGAAAAPAASGAPPSNTAPNNSNQGGGDRTTIVGAGVDSLYLSIPGTLRPGTQSLLERLKEQAQSYDSEVRALAQYPNRDWIFQVSDKGVRLFSFILTDSRYRIEIARPSVSLPLAHVQVSSAALAAYGVAKCVADLMLFLGDIGDIQGDPVVSRADLFVDVTTSCDLTRLEDEQWVTRAHSKARYSEQGHRSGYVIGRGGDISLRLYDKTLEILGSGKDHAKRQWNERGWDGVSQVWRVEAQIRRNALHQFAIRTVEELIRRMRELWRYVVEKWCRLSVPNPDDQTPSRWLTHPFWKAIEEAADFHTLVSIGRRVLRRAKAPSDWFMARAFLADLTSFMATYEIFDTAWAFEDFVEMVKGAFKLLEENGGIALSRYIAQRVALKTRAFGTGAAFRVPPEIPLEIRSRPRQGRLDDADEY